MARMFGTDGVRGIAGKELTAPLAKKIGAAAAAELTLGSAHHPTVLIGRDPRASGTMLEKAVAEGLCEAGARVFLLGVVPTPAVAYLITLVGADAGVMISASHNPYEYNGIKLFGADGCKLGDDTEDAIEALVRGGVFPEVAGGEICTTPQLTADYLAHLAAAYAGGYTGRVLVDCANGSASATARQLFAKIGVTADFLFDTPDGENINFGCGSTHIEALSAGVTAGHYDLGLAFDGDADRLLAVDETGAVLDGDYLLAIFAEYLRRQNRLKSNTVVVTTMSNLGFFKLMEARGIRTAVTRVGDRYVLEEMRRHGHSLGGEQSGHMILWDSATTGDGQLSAMVLLSALALFRRPLSALAAPLRHYPQVQVNVPATPRMKEEWEKNPAVRAAVSAGEKQLCGNGRILVRPSGTEPLLRVMVEGEDEAVIRAIAEEVARTIAAAFAEGEE